VPADEATASDASTPEYGESAPAGFLPSLRARGGGDPLTRRAMQRLVIRSKGRTQPRPAQVKPYLLRRPIPSKEEFQASEAALAYVQDLFADDEHLEEEDPAIRTQSRLENVRRTFLRANGKTIDDANLGTLTPTSLDTGLAQRFMDAVDLFGPETLTLGYHGTPESNLVPILEQGLRVPRKSSEVANGNVHGRGIYLAEAGAHWLSQGFLKGSRKLLICGVVDTVKVALAPDGERPAANDQQTKVTSRRYSCRGGVPAHRVTKRPLSRLVKTQTRTIRGQPVKAENQHVRHVGSAMVVFRESHVAPLFIAEAASPNGTFPATLPATSSAVSHDVYEYTAFDLRPPENRVPGTQQLPGTRRCWDGNAGKVVWLAPVASTDSHAIAMKRRLVRRERDMERKACRMPKW